MPIQLIFPHLDSLRAQVAELVLSVPSTVPKSGSELGRGQIPKDSNHTQSVPAGHMMGLSQELAE